MHSDTVSDDLLPLTRQKFELSAQESHLLCGSQVTVFTSYMRHILKMKNLAWQYVWWPGMDADQGKDVTHSHSCPLKMDGHAHHQFCNLSSDNGNDEEQFCYTWIARDSSH